MIFFSLQGKAPRRPKYIWDKYIVWDGVRSLSLATALDGTAIQHLQITYSNKISVGGLVLF